MSRFVRPLLARSTVVTSPAFGVVESARQAVACNGAGLAGPLRVRAVNAQKLGGGANTTTIRLYSAASGGVLLYEQSHVFAADAAWARAAPTNPVILMRGEPLHATWASDGGAGHTAECYVEVEFTG